MIAVFTPAAAEWFLPIKKMRICTVLTGGKYFNNVCIKYLNLWHMYSCHLKTAVMDL